MEATHEESTRHPQGPSTHESRHDRQHGDDHRAGQVHDHLLSQGAPVDDHRRARAEKRPGMIRAAIYARKSTLDECDERDGKSTARQAEFAKEFIASKGWTFTGRTFVDEGISGGVFDLNKRTGLRDMLAALK